MHKKTDRNSNKLIVLLALHPSHLKGDVHKVIGEIGVTMQGHIYYKSLFKKKNILNEAQIKGKGEINMA